MLIDPNAMATRGISVADLSTALATVASDAPAGNLSAGDQSLLVRADASVKSAEEIEAIKINKSTSIGDVADVIFGPAEETSSIRINGQTGIGLGIVRQAQSNTLDISTGVRAAVAEIDASLPPGVHIRVTSDESTFIGGALTKVLHTLGEATLIVVTVIFLFLRSGARDDHPGDHRADRADRNARRDLSRRVLDQHPDAARDRARDRPRGRRRHRGA